MKVKPLTIELNTDRDQAEHFIKREFKITSFHFIKSRGIKIIYPEDNHLINEYLNYDQSCEDRYRKYNDDFCEDSFHEYVLNLDSFQDWRDGLFLDYYPMWNTVFCCDRFYIDSSYCDVNVLYDLGIGVLELGDEYFLFIPDAGHDLYDAHWVPLFKHLGWIKEIK